VRITNTKTVTCLNIDPSSREGRCPMTSSRDCQTAAKILGLNAKME